MMNTHDTIFLLSIIGIIFFLFIFSYKRENLTMWKGVSMDFNNCKPYCSTFCKEKTVRGPSGLIESQCFVKCGKVCCTDSDCPASCPMCADGVCQSGVRVPYS